MPYEATEAGIEVNPPMTAAAPHATIRGNCMGEMAVPFNSPVSEEELAAIQASVEDMRQRRLLERLQQCQERRRQHERVDVEEVGTSERMAWQREVRERDEVIASLQERLVEDRRRLSVSDTDSQDPHGLATMVNSAAYNGVPRGQSGPMFIQARHSWGEYGQEEATDDVEEYDVHEAPPPRVKEPMCGNVGRRADWAYSHAQSGVPMIRQERSDITLPGPTQGKRRLSKQHDRGEAIPEVPQEANGSARGENDVAYVSVPSAHRQPAGGTGAQITPPPGLPYEGGAPEDKASLVQQSLEGMAHGTGNPMEPAPYIVKNTFIESAEDEMACARAKAVKFRSEQPSRQPSSKELSVASCIQTLRSSLRKPQSLTVAPSDYDVDNTFEEQPEDVSTKAAQHTLKQALRTCLATPLSKSASACAHVVGDDAYVEPAEGSREPAEALQSTQAHLAAH
jgi:hypothetical protein